MPDPNVVPLNPRSRAGKPRAPGDLVAPVQGTYILGPDQVIAFGHPDRYASPLFNCSFLNTGPGAISARWDGNDTIFGAPDAVLCPPGTGYAEARTIRMVFAADGAGATVSVTCDNSFG